MADPIVVSPRNLAELRSYYDRQDPLESSLDLSLLGQLGVRAQDELRTFAQSLAVGRPRIEGAHAGLTTVVAQVLNTNLSHALSDLLSCATRLEKLTIFSFDNGVEVVGGGNNNTRMYQAVRDLTNPIISGVIQNTTCRLKTLKLSSLVDSQTLINLFSAPCCNDLECLDIVSTRPMDSESLLGFGAGVRQLRNLKRVSIDCAQAIDTITLINLALEKREIDHLQVRVRCNRDAPFLMHIFVPLLCNSSAKALRITAFEIGGHINALEFLCKVQIAPSLQHLELVGFHLADKDDSGVPPFNFTLRTLKLTRCRFGPRPMSFLLSFRGVEILELDHCTPADTQPCRAFMFQHNLPNLPRLKTLQVSTHVQLQNSFVRDLAAGLSQATQLEATTLALDSSGSMDGQTATNLVQSSRSRSLSIQVRNTGDLLCPIHAFGAGLRGHGTIKHFRLDYRSPSQALTSADFQSVMDAACTLQGLESFHLSVDHLTAIGRPTAVVLDTGCARLGCQLLQSATLRTLGMGRCVVPLESMEILLEGLRARESSSSLRLDFESVAFGADTLARFASEVPLLPCLKELKLSMKFLSDDEVRSFLEHLSSMQHLQVLEFEQGLSISPDNGFGDLVVAGLRDNASLANVVGLEYASGTYPTKAQVDWYLRRNRYGWRLVDPALKVPRGLWPRVLERIACDGDDDAHVFMFMFLRSVKSLHVLDPDLRRMISDRTGD